MLCKVPLVSADDDLSQLFPRQDEETIAVPVFTQHDHDEPQLRIWLWFWLADNLALPTKFNVSELPDTELPVRAVDRFYLNRKVSTIFS